MSAKARLEQATKYLADAQEHFDIHSAGEMAAASNPSAWEKWRGEHRRLALELERRTKLAATAKADAAAEAERHTWQLVQVRARNDENGRVAALLQQEGAELWPRLLALLTTVAEADAATAKLNAMLLPDINRVETVDAIARGRDMRPREDLSERTIELWVSSETGNPVSVQDAVRSISNGLGLLPTAAVQGERVKCVRRRFRQVEYHPEAPAERVEPFLNSLRLPRYDGPGFAWKGDYVHGAQAALEVLNQSCAQEKRPVLTELVPEGSWSAPVIPRRKSART